MDDSQICLINHLLVIFKFFWIFFFLWWWKVFIKIEFWKCHYGQRIWTLFSFWTQFTQLFSRNVISITVSPEVCDCVHLNVPSYVLNILIIIFTNMRDKLMYIINSTEVEFLYLLAVLLICLCMCVCMCVWS